MRSENTVLCSTDESPRGYSTTWNAIGMEVAPDVVLGPGKLYRPSFLLRYTRHVIIFMMATLGLPRIALYAWGIPLIYVEHHDCQDVKPDCAPNKGKYAVNLIH